MTMQSEQQIDRLPPISAMDKYLANRSVPSSSSLTTPIPIHPSPSKSAFYFDQRSSLPAIYTSPVQNHHHRQLSLPGNTFTAGPSTPSPHRYTANHPPTATDRNIDLDIDEVVRHCDIIGDHMRQYKDCLVDDTHDPDHTRLWLDDMVSRANEVLNSLLRLRKHRATNEYPPSTRNSRSLSKPASSRQANRTEWQDTLSLSTIRQRKRGKRTVFQGRCHSCNISETPEWRRGPDGARTLCNACGLHYAKLARKKARQEQGQEKRAPYDTLVPDLSVKKSNPLLSPATTDEPLDDAESMVS